MMAMADPENTPAARIPAVSGRGEASIEVRGSTFIGHVQAVETVEAAEDRLAEIKAGSPDATYHVPAYRIRRVSGRGESLREWSNDAGEPSGSAGKPVLNVLTSRELENVVAVVTRSFGGNRTGRWRPRPGLQPSGHGGHPERRRGQLSSSPAVRHRSRVR
jgi:putative IMPACT (imprinted ancient) family translation regulator